MPRETIEDTKKQAEYAKEMQKKHKIHAAKLASGKSFSFQLPSHLQKLQEQIDRESKSVEETEIETESQKKQERFAHALEFLTAEKWKEIQETMIEPMQTKISEAHERLNRWREDYNRFINYVYKDYQKALLRAVRKELKKWKKQTFTERVEELEKENRAISGFIHEMDSIFESMVIEFAERLGKQQKKSKKQKKRKR